MVDTASIDVLDKVNVVVAMVKQEVKVDELLDVAFITGTKSNKGFGTIMARVWTKVVVIFDQTALH